MYLSTRATYIPSSSSSSPSSSLSCLPPWFSPNKVSSNTMGLQSIWSQQVLNIDDEESVFYLKQWLHSWLSCWTWKWCPVDIPRCFLDACGATARASAARIFSRRHILGSDGAEIPAAAGVRARRSFQGCLVNERLINVLPRPLQTKGLECRRMPANLGQMEEIRSRNRILIAGQRTVYKCKTSITLLDFRDLMSGSNRQYKNPASRLSAFLFVHAEIHSSRWNRWFTLWMRPWTTALNQNITAFVVELTTVNTVVVQWTCTSFVAIGKKHKSDSFHNEMMMPSSRNILNDDDLSLPQFSPTDLAHPSCGALLTIGFRQMFQEQ